MCRIVAYAIDTSDPENMTIERYGRLPIDQSTIPQLVPWRDIKISHRLLTLCLLSDGPLPLLLIPVPSAPEAFILVTV